MGKKDKKDHKNVESIHSDSDVEDNGREGKKKEDSKGEAFKVIKGTISPIAKPLADEKLAKKVFKTVKKATKAKLVRRGVKETVKSIRKGHKGIIVLAGDISPMDVISHIPVLAEEASLRYIFIDSKGELGLASHTKRPTSCLMLSKPGTAGGSNSDKEDYEKYYEKLYSYLGPFFQ
jgi:H/ACA ribonucleoprotein complex subunit 2